MYRGMLHRAPLPAYSTAMSYCLSSLRLRGIVNDYRESAQERVWHWAAPSERDTRRAEVSVRQRQASHVMYVL